MTGLRAEAIAPQSQCMAVRQLDRGLLPVNVCGGSEIRVVLLRMMLRFIDEHIADAHLGPGLLANEFHISKRYVHKVFATTGTTFGAYVTVRRLEGVSKALMSDSTRQRELIASIARRWGFRDISGFNRAFKRQFGCSPRVFRMRRVV